MLMVSRTGGDGRRQVLSFLVRDNFVGLTATEPLAVRETPAILGVVSVEEMLKDILDELDDLGQSGALQVRLDAILSRIALPRL